MASPAAHLAVLCGSAVEAGQRRELSRTARCSRVLAASTSCLPRRPHPLRPVPYLNSSHSAVVQRPNALFTSTSHSTPHRPSLSLTHARLRRHHNAERRVPSTQLPPLAQRCCRTVHNSPSLSAGVAPPRCTRPTPLNYPLQSSIPAPLSKAHSLITVVLSSSHPVRRSLH